MDLTALLNDPAPKKSSVPPPRAPPAGLQTYPPPPPHPHTPQHAPHTPQHPPPHTPFRSPGPNQYEQRPAHPPQYHGAQQPGYPFPAPQQSPAAARPQPHGYDSARDPYGPRPPQHHPPHLQHPQAIRTPPPQAAPAHHPPYPRASPVRSPVAQRAHIPGVSTPISRAHSARDVSVSPKTRVPWELEPEGGRERKRPGSPLEGSRARQANGAPAAATAVAATRVAADATAPPDAINTGGARQPAAAQHQPHHHPQHHNHNHTHTHTQHHNHHHRDPLIPASIPGRAASSSSTVSTATSGTASSSSHAEKHPRPKMDDTTTTTSSSSSNPPPRKRVRKDDAAPIWARKASRTDAAPARPPPPPAADPPRPPPQQQPPRPAAPAAPHPASTHPPAPAASTPHPPAALAPPRTLPSYGPWEPSISGAEPFEELTRMLADFLFHHVVSCPPDFFNTPGAPVLEIEAKLGELIDVTTNARVALPVRTETVFDSDDPSWRVRFASSMTPRHHQAANAFLNRCFKAANTAADAGRLPMRYTHTKETDAFFELPADGYRVLPALVRDGLSPRNKLRVRVTRDTKSGEVLRKMVKARIADVNVYSPRTAFDWRVSVNMEMPWEGEVEGLYPLGGGTGGDGDRVKDRVSYRSLVYQVDLTEVTGNDKKEHELEVEVDGQELRKHGLLARDGKPNGYEAMVKGFVDNVRVLVRAAGSAQP